MKNIDMESEEFKKELEKTWSFVDKVNKQFGFVQNPNSEVNDGVAMGLARNKLIYNKRFCPCFMVIGETKEEQKTKENRICPCKPAIEVEIPNDGLCHCGIFCTSAYAEDQKKETTSKQETVEQTNQEAETLMKQEQLTDDELKSLLNFRELKKIDFSLIDVREDMEFKIEHIIGTDTLMPTSQFYDKVKELESKKNDNIILYCHSGSRSFQVQQALKEMGYKVVLNLKNGISDFSGKTKKS